jgi:diguanylate cyclase
MKVYTQNKYESEAILVKVLDIFEKHNITPNPMNFLVWYEYFLASNPKLITVLDNAMQNRDGFTNTLGVRLYEEFLKEQQADTSDLERAFRRLLERMVSKLMDWTKNMDSHTQELDHYVNQLSSRQDIDSEMLRNLTGSVLSTTKSIVATQSEIQQDMVAATKHIAKLQKELEDARTEAMTDMLTKLANRRWFEQDLELAMQATKNNNELSVILTDIDFFKKFNDNYGHQIGDAVLRFISSILKKNVEPSQLVARIGGEEFAILVPNATVEEAFTLAEHLRHKVEISHLKRKDTGETIGNITISLGVASYRVGEDWDSLYMRADKALYESKKTGRNKTTLAPL